MAPPLTADDLRLRARRRLPRFIFDFIDGGAGDETALLDNREAFRRRPLLPRILSLPEPPRRATTLLGESFALPVGIAPMGLANLVAPGTDRGLARASAAAGIPLGLSMLASSSVEAMAAIAGPRTWLQLYAGLGDSVTADLIDRAEAAGVTTLLFTVDANHPGQRLRDRRNGFPASLRRLSTALDLARHPRWSLASLRGGAPRPVNLEAAMSGSGVPLAQVIAGMAQAPLDWSLFDALRRRWRRRLILKGVLAPEDAAQARDRGADAVVVSNHGARQLATVIPSVTMLPAVRQRVGPGFPLLLDSGVRTGEDIAKALALGADFVLIGRPFLFAAAALGADAGPLALVRMLEAELTGALAQLGCGDVMRLRDGRFVL